MKVAIVHDDLVQWGGAEKVLLAISEVFPEAPIYTSVFNQSNRILAEKFAGKKIVTSFLQKIPGWEKLYKALLPLYPVSFEQFDFSEFDLVISQTTRFAKSIITKPGTLHICYMHTPPRFLWNFSSESAPKILSPYLSFLRMYDQVSARRVDLFLAGSKNCQQRIRAVYKKDSEVLYPFVETEKMDAFNGDYYLLIARLNHYKRVDLAVKAFNELGLKLRIVGVGPESQNLKLSAKSNIEFLGSVSEGLLNNLLSGCKALVITGEEDFGMTSLEAQSFGKPVLAFGKGGAMETVIEGKTGIFFKDQTTESLKEGIKKLEKVKFRDEEVAENSEGFSREGFKVNLKALVEAGLKKEFMYNI